MSAIDMVFQVEVIPPVALASEVYEPMEL